MDTGRARAMVDLGYAGLYLLALTGAHLWSAPALFVIALFCPVENRDDGLQSHQSRPGQSHGRIARRHVIGPHGVAGDL